MVGNRACSVRQEAVVHGTLSAQGRKYIPLGSVALIESLRLGNLQQRETDFRLTGLDWQAQDHCRVASIESRWSWKPSIPPQEPITFPGHHNANQISAWVSGGRGPTYLNLLTLQLCWLALSLSLLCRTKNNLYPSLTTCREEEEGRNLIRHRDQSLWSTRVRLSKSLTHFISYRSTARHSLSYAKALDRISADLAIFRRRQPCGWGLRVLRYKQLFLTDLLLSFLQTLYKTILYILPEREGTS